MKEVKVLTLHDDLLPMYYGNVSKLARFLGMNRSTLKNVYMPIKNSIWVAGGVVMIRKGLTREEK